MIILQRDKIASNTVSATITIAAIIGIRGNFKVLSTGGKDKDDGIETATQVLEGLGNLSNTYSENRHC